MNRFILKPFCAQKEAINFFGNEENYSNLRFFRQLFDCFNCQIFVKFFLTLRRNTVTTFYITHKSCSIFTFDSSSNPDIKTTQLQTSFIQLPLVVIFWSDALVPDCFHTPPQTSWTIKVHRPSWLLPVAGQRL